MNDDRYLCLMCHGSGFFAESEGEHEVRDTCLHCQGKGYVPYNVAFADSLVSLGEAIAEAIVMNQKKTANESESGEGWAFHAAENRMTEYDYTRTKIWETMPIVENNLKSLPISFLKALLNIAKIEMPLFVDPNLKSINSDRESDIDPPPF